MARCSSTEEFPSKNEEGLFGFFLDEGGGEEAGRDSDGGSWEAGMKFKGKARDF